MNGFHTGHGSSPGNPRLYFPEIEYDLLKVELMHQRRVSSKAKCDGDWGVTPAGTVGLLVAEPVLKICVCMRFSKLAHSIPYATLYMQQIQICMHVYTQKTNAARHAQAEQKDVGGVTQAL